jgi:hypothetical protein
MSQTLIISDELYQQLTLIAQRRGLASVEQLLEVWQATATALPSQAGAIDLHSLGIDKTQVADLRARLRAFAEDWERPEMDVYDEYDNARAAV